MIFYRFWRDIQAYSYFFRRKIFVPAEKKYLSAFIRKRFHTFLILLSKLIEIDHLLSGIHKRDAFQCLEVVSVKVASLKIFEHPIPDGNF